MPVSPRIPAVTLACRNASWRVAPGLGLLLLTLCGLAGCGGNDLPKFPPACPSLQILQDGADLTRFRGNGTDLTDVELDGRMLRPTGKCSLDDLTHLRTTVSVSMDLTRGPALLGRQTDVTYFVSVARGATILDEANYTFHVNFPPNSERVRLVGDQIDLVLPVDAKTSGAVYDIRVAFRLTPQQLAFNRQRGPR